MGNFKLNICFDGSSLSSINSDHGLSKDAKKNTAGIAAIDVLRLLNPKGGVELKIKKGIPFGSGLGRHFRGNASVYNLLPFPA